MSEKNGTNGMRALVVDDEEEVRGLLEKQLRALEFDPVVAGSGKEAEARMEEEGEPFALCVVDVSLPDINGLEVTKRLRGREEYANLPVIFVSGRYSAEDLKKVEKAFANSASLSKPYEKTDLRAAIERLMPQRGEMEAEEDAVYRIVVDHDGLEVKLYPADRANMQDLVDNVDAVNDVLREEGVTHGVDRAMIDNAFHRGTVRFEADGGILIARGKPPKNGKHGKLEPKVDLTGRALYQGGNTSADDGAIDFKSSMRIQVVNPGDTLAVLEEPSRGQPGVSLKGTAIPARDGKRKQIHLGEGVELKEKGTLFVATITGRPLLRGDTILVSPELTIPGDVDMSVGNVEFEGFVNVKGNVLDGFSVTSNGLTVEGFVGAATVVCHGPAEIAGGINGQGRAVLTIEGEFRTKYINQATVTCHGDVIVRKEIVNSRVWTHGKVSTGKLIGGECLAQNGVEVTIAGSDMGVKTVIEPGVNYEIRRIDQEMATVDQEIEKLLRPVEGFFGDRARFQSLPPEKQEAFQKTFEHFLELKEKHLALSAEKRHIHESTDYQPRKTVRVKKMIFPDVLVRTDLCMRYFSESLRGPASLEEDVNNATICPKPYRATD